MMYTFPIQDDSGSTYAFEIESVYVSIGEIISILSKVESISDLSRKELFRSGEAAVDFIFKGNPCMVWEPYGDSSRYWIGQIDSSRHFDFFEVEKEFRNYRPRIIRRIMGDLLTIKFIPRSFMGGFKGCFLCLFSVF